MAYDIQPIYARQVNCIYRLCYLFWQNTAATEKAVQEVFLTCLREEKSFAQEKEEKAFLVQQAYSYYKKNYRPSLHKREEAAATAAILQNAAQKEQILTLAKSILKLHPHQQMAFYFYYFERLSCADIAFLTGQKETQVQKQLLQAQKLCQLETGGEYCAPRPSTQRI